MNGSMRLGLYAFAMFAAALTGCDSGGGGSATKDDASVTPDMGGEGEMDMAVEADMAVEPDMAVEMEECDGLTVLDLNAEGTPEGDGFRVSGSTGAVDNFAGSCTTNDGSDAIVKFTAPAAGLWLFSTAETAGDTVLYALGDCNDGFSELACNDNINAGMPQSEIAFELDAGAVAYVIVDNSDLVAAAPFTLTAQPIDAEPPTLASVELFLNPNTRAIGVRVAGADPNDDVVAFDIALLDGGGMELAAGMDIPLDDFDFTQADGMFQGDLVLGLPQGTEGTARIAFAVSDRFGLKSDVVMADAMAPPGGLMRGDECVPAQVFGLCDEADACVDADPNDEDPAVCVEATPPTITSAEAFANAEDGLLGIRVAGEDPEDNAAAVSLLPFNGDAELSLIESGGAATAGLQAISADGAYTGTTAVNFINACFPAAQAYFDMCAGAGGNQETCVEEANALLAMCNMERVAEVTAVQVAVIDNTGKQSEPFMVEMVPPTPTVMENDECDIPQALAICPEEMFCFNVGAADDSPICQPPSEACAESWTVVDLNANGEGPWSYDGDSADATNLGGGASCGGGGAQAVHSFTAPAAGTYTARVTMATDARDGVMTDTLLFARTHCPLPQADFEISCNDDVEQGNLLSAIQLELEADQTAYIFVDGYTGQGAPGFAGSYTLTVTAP